MKEWLDSESDGSSKRKKILLGTLSPERLQAAGVDFGIPSKAVLFAA
jgi:hypothetical protein